MFLVYRRGTAMNGSDDRVHDFINARELTQRRTFLMTGALTIADLALSPLFAASTSSATHRYKLAPESLLPADIRKAPVEVREAYRFAIANRDTLRYIPCYCDCGDQGHTSNASCYFQDNSTPEKPVFDRMSLA
jgi:Protein of unknown function with PCYCGC motif